MNKVSEDGKNIKGLHTYDMLANPRVALDLAYIACDIKNRGNLIIDFDENHSNNNAHSDMVRAVLGIAYLRDYEKFQFTQDYMMTLAEKDSEAAIN